METKCLQEEFIILKTAIEEAIKKGQKSSTGTSDIREFDIVTREDSVCTCIEACSGVVGRVDDC